MIHTGGRGGAGGRQPVGPAPYHADAVRFDGSAYLSINGLTATDGDKFSASWWFKISQAAFDAVGVPWVGDPGNNYLNGASYAHDNVLGNVFVQDLTDASGVIDLDVSTQGTSISADTWHHIILSAETNFPMGSKLAKLYLDGVDITNIVSESDAFTMTFNGLSFFFGSDGSAALVGDVADPWIAPNVSLLVAGDIPAGTLALFRDPITGKPVSPSGFPASAILFSGNASAFPVNQGTGGAFTLTGTLTDASTSPSD